MPQSDYRKKAVHSVRSDKILVETGILPEKKFDSKKYDEIRMVYAVSVLLKNVGPFSWRTETAHLSKEESDVLSSLNYSAPKVFGNLECLLPEMHT